MYKTVYHSESHQNYAKFHRQDTVLGPQSVEAKTQPEAGHNGT